uniref:Uncharacterized protein n=1 Tax=Anguilla anguilla TaxID=7936 RepID=A0A0E9WJJ7_ANGAN
MCINCMAGKWKKFLRRRMVMLMNMTAINGSHD